jgi:outer membrane protein TolC
VGVRASYPLFTSREVERNIRAEQQRLSAAALREDKTRAVLREEYTRLQAENRKIGRQLDAARAQLAQAEELYRITRLKYDQGAGAPSDLLEAAELLLNSRQRCLDLTRSSLLTRWAAFRLQGKLLAELQGGTQP